MYSIKRTATARVLRVLSEEGPRNMSEVARKSELAFSYMFRVLPEMEKDGLVVSEKKGKEKIFQLTDYGRDVYNILFRRRLLEVVKPVQKEERPHLLQAMEPNITELPLPLAARSRAIRAPRRRPSSRKRKPQ